MRDQSSQNLAFSSHESMALGSKRMNLPIFRNGTRRSATNRRTKRSLTPNRSASPATSHRAGAFGEWLSRSDVMSNLWPELLGHWDTEVERSSCEHAEAATWREKLISQRIAWPSPNARVRRTCRCVSGFSVREINLDCRFCSVTERGRNVFQNRWRWSQLCQLARPIP